MTIVRDASGRELAFEVAQRHMDVALLEKVQASADPADPQAIFEAYARAHVGKYHQSFAPFTGGRW
jgi:hypothetical protein